MKHITSLFCATVAGLAFTYSTTAYSQNLKEGLASIVRVKGPVSYTLGGNDAWHPLVAGKILRPGATIRTGPDAMVDVVLGKAIGIPQARPTPDRIAVPPDANVVGLSTFTPSVEQNVIRLSSETTVKVDTLTVGDTGLDTISDTELDLQKGRIFYSVKKLSTESKFLVKIPNGIAGIRGSQGFISADGKCGALVHPLWLSLVGSDGKPMTITIGEGQQYDPSTGQSSPMSSQILGLLQDISLSARTSYLEADSYAFDYNKLCWISPTTGNTGHKKP